MNASSEQAKAARKSTPGAVGRWPLLMRSSQIAAISTKHLVMILSSGAAGWVFGERHASSRRLFRAVVDWIEDLGPTFVKFAQILSSRRDVLPTAFCNALAVLHDNVPALNAEETKAALTAAYGAGEDAKFRHEDLELLASGSIASVFRAISKSGEEVALKLQRPGIREAMVRDLGLMERAVRMAEHLPKFKGMPLGDLVRYVSTAILGQLDFQQEARNLQCLHCSVAAVRGVCVPAPISHLCGPNALAMQFIPGLHARTIETLTPNEREYLADTALMAVGHLMFVNGFAHCDLHPGNLYALTAGELVILDAGFSVIMPENVRLLMGEFFYCMMTRNGTRCAEIIIDSAERVRPDTDLGGFVSSVSSLVQEQSHESVFSMAVFGNKIFDLQQKFGLYAKSDFAFPMMSLAVLEGTLRQLHPNVDFQQLGTASDPVARSAHV